MSRGLNKANRIREDDWTPSSCDCQCIECKTEIRRGEPIIRVSYRGYPQAMCEACALAQIGGARPPEDMI